MSVPEQEIEINIEKILGEIRGDIIAKGYTNDMLSFQDVGIPDSTTAFNLPHLKAEVDTLNSAWNIPAYRPLNSGGLKGFIKKVIRKLTKFYVEPIALDQSSFNGTVVRSINEISAFIDLMSDTNEKIDRINYNVEHRLKRECDRSLKKAEQLSECSQEIIRQNESLKKLCDDQRLIIEKLEKQIELLDVRTKLLEAENDKLGG